MARAALEILYATGMRVSELLSLPRTALTGDAALLLIRGKGGKERMVPLSDAARDAAAALAATTDKDGRAAFTPKTGNYFLIVAHHTRTEAGAGYGETKYAAPLPVLVPDKCPCCDE